MLMLSRCEVGGWQQSDDISSVPHYLVTIIVNIIVIVNVNVNVIVIVIVIVINVIQVICRSLAADDISSVPH